MLRIEIIESPPELTLSLTGRLDTITAPQLEKTLKKQRKTSKKQRMKLRIVWKKRLRNSLKRTRKRLKKQMMHCRRQSPM